jgi:protein TonB
VTAGDSANTSGETRAATETFARAAYAFHPKPDYPERAKREGWEGTVLLEVLINSQGDPERVAVARSSGFALLDNAAREAVKGWRFRPASMGEHRIASVERVPVVFRLETGN